MKSKQHIASVILAAGMSTRMGSPKALLELEGETFLELVVRAHQSFSHRIVLVVGQEEPAIREQINLSGLEVICNPKPERGPLSSLQLALTILPKTDALILHPVDHPLVTPTTICELAAAHLRVPACIWIPQCLGQKGHPVLFPSRFYADLRRAPLQEGARWVVRQNQSFVQLLKVSDPGIFQNINLPQQYAEVRGFPPLIPPFARR